MQFTPITLQTEQVILQPLSEQHLPALLKAGQPQQIWQWVFENYCLNEQTLWAWYQSSAQFDAHQQLVFATFDKARETLVGTTRLFRLDTQNNSLEIGHTFIHPDWQRSYINTHAKYLMLKYAFETLGIARVSFVTHEKNTLSRNAISRLGATFEGIIRKVRLLPNGEYRNSAQFSITDDDWPTIKQTLETMMQEWQ
jgi:RimJ/RimL family protein N-acetyltransferase